MSRGDVSIVHTIITVLYYCKFSLKQLTHHIFQTIKHTYNPLFFSKMKRVPYSPEHLMCESDCALSPSSEQILC